ncbi:MAG: hypothetical protein KGV46_01770 [Pasteurella sp.]|nr:hypothetical protein [Pasteurella sp.]
MPVVIGVAAGAAGLYKVYQAISGNNMAESLNEKASSIVNSAENKLNKSRKNYQESLKQLGQKKANIIAKNVSNFITTYEQINNVDFAENTLGDLTVNEFNEKTLEEMRKSVDFVLESGLNIGSGALVGALTAFGAYNATVMFSAAGTGMAIESLGGAATAEFLGSSVISGIFGTGGTLALGALTAGPALLAMGWYMESQAEKSLDEARSNHEKAKKYVSNADAESITNERIKEVAIVAISVLSNLAKHSRRATKKLADIIAEQGTNYTEYNDKAKNIVLYNVKLMQLIKATIEIDIVGEKGILLENAIINLDKIKQDIQKITV